MGNEKEVLGSELFENILYIFFRVEEKRQFGLARHHRQPDGLYPQNVLESVFQIFNFF